MKKLVLVAFMLAGSLFADDLIKGEAKFGVDETTQKLQSVISEAGVKVFSVFDHSTLAKEAGLDMPNTKVVVFGSPKVGTLLMQCVTDVAIDLPLKFLVSEVDGKSMVAYEDIKSIASRHNADKCEIVDMLSKAQAKFFKAVTK
ncbi:DUF302 domain-containing protein [Campylobacter suis]|uniref:DUF302 domain-containing protein n=1 Tax=Campylobacter suis TaxID=2790657 RepID=A0ABN7K1Z1_9BACT|nr:DUF302 domain-containing protein [Campylobacter suis]CAD7286543.1 hypothetical protein LMG8286_00376 [Campylobacter suis]